MAVIIVEKDESVIEVVNEIAETIVLGDSGEEVIVVSEQGATGATGATGPVGTTVHDDTSPTGDGPEYNHLNDTQKALLHTESHSITSHSDIADATGAQIEELTGGGDTTLHDHEGISENTNARHTESHSIVSHNDTTATGTELESLTNGSDADALHNHPLYSGKPENTITVGKSNCQYTTIQAGINAAVAAGADTDHRFQVFVYPGFYTENVVCPGYVGVLGFGGLMTASTVINPGSGVGYTQSGLGGIWGIQIDMDVTASGTGNHRCVDTSGMTGIQNCRLLMTCATNNVVNSLIRQTGGVLVLNGGMLTYTHTGTSATVNTHNIIDLQGGSGFDFYSVECGAVIGDQADSIAYINETYAVLTKTRCQSNHINISCTNVAYSGHCCVFSETAISTGADLDKDIINNLIDLTSAGGIGIGEIYHIETGSNNGIINSALNTLTVTGFASNYIAEIKSGDTLNSHFDTLKCADEYHGTGTYTFVNSPSNGNIQCSGSYLNMYDAVKTIGPRGCDYTIIQTALTDNPTENILFTVQPDTYVNDTINFTANNQTIQGVSDSNKDAEITNTTTICNYGAFTNCKVSRIYVKQTQASSDPVVTGTGSCSFVDVINELICGAGTGTGTPLIPRNYTGSGIIKILRGEVIQSNASSVDGDYANFASPIVPSAGGSVNVDGSKITLNQTGKHYICFGIGTLSSGSFEVNRTEIIVNTTTCTFSVGLMGNNATGVNFAAFNKISVLGTCLYAIGVSGMTTSTLTINSSYSSYIIESGTSSNIGVSAGSLVIINTSFDVYLTTTFSDGVGTINSISSDSPGNLSLSNVLTTKEFWLSDTVYDDWSSALSSNQPTNPSAKINPNDAEASVTFDNDTNLTDYLYFSPQMPHKWKLGTVIYPHLHWWQTTTNQPNWLLQYRWQKNDGLKTTTWTYLPLDAEIFTWSTGTLNQISYNATGITPPSGYSISDIIQFRLLRDVADTSGEWGSTAETSPVSADAVSFDYHYEIDSLGSRDEYTK